MPLNGTTVLVVEDDPQFLDIVEGWLSDSYAVRTATDGEEALDEVDEDVDVVLLDRRLPDVHGDEVLEEIRSQGYDCRVAMVTAIDPDFDILEMEFDDYVVKPALRGEIESVVEGLVDRASFDEKVQERFALSTKLAALETEKPMTILRENEDYLDAKARLDELNDEIDQLIDRSTEREAAVEMYYELDLGEENVPTN